MKYIKLVDKLATRADNKGFARVNGYYCDGLYPDELTEKYSVTVNNDTATLQHWGTVTAIVDISKHEIKYIYGQSVSDADSIGTFLDHYGANEQDTNVTVHDEVTGDFTFKPTKVFLGYYPSKEKFHIDVNDKGRNETGKQYLIGMFDSGVNINW